MVDLTHKGEEHRLFPDGVDPNYRLCLALLDLDSTGPPPVILDLHILYPVRWRLKNIRGNPQEMSVAARMERQSQE